MSSDAPKPVYTRSDFTKAFAEEAIETYGGITKAARELAPRCKIKGDGPPTPHTVLLWLHEAKDRVGPPGSAELGLMSADEEYVVNRIRKLVKEANLSPDSIERLKTVRLNSWGVSAKVKNPITGKEELETKDLFSTQIILEPREKYEPKWPVVQPAKPVLVTYRPPIQKPRVQTHRTIVALPDHQVGYLRDIDEVRVGDTLTCKLHPVHDRRAIDLAQQIVNDLKPSGLGHMGDFWDLTEMSKWPQMEEFFRTTQISIDEGNRILADYEAAAGPPSHRETTWWIEGNHDRRMEDYLQKNARAAFGLRAADATPKSWPTSSIMHYVPVMREFEYCGNYPGSEKWIVQGRNGLVARHNPDKGYEASVLCGHTHHSNRTIDSLRNSDGQRHRERIETGCLCRIDSDVAKHRLTRTPVPSDRGHIRGWTQSITVITVDGENWDVEMPRFYSLPNGKLSTTFRGRRYVSARNEP